MKKHVIKICQAAYFELKCICSIGFLIEDAAKTLATSYILSRLDYCNCLLMGVHLILSSNLSIKFKTLLQGSFSWYPITTTQRLSWKNCTGFPFQNILNIKSLVCFSAVNGSGPAYLSELLHVYTLSHTLRSSSDTRMLKIQQCKHKTQDFHIFSCFGPHIWNSLPQDLRHCSTLSSFKAKLKPFLFSQYFHPS